MEDYQLKTKDGVSITGGISRVPVQSTGYYILPLLFLILQLPLAGQILNFAFSAICSNSCFSLDRTKACCWGGSGALLLIGHGFLIVGNVGVLVGPVRRFLLNGQSLMCDIPF